MIRFAAALVLALSATSMFASDVVITPAVGPATPGITYTAKPVHIPHTSAPAKAQLKTTAIRIKR